MPSTSPSAPYTSEACTSAPSSARSGGEQPRLLARRRRARRRDVGVPSPWRPAGPRRARPEPQPGTYGHLPVRQHAEGHAWREACGQEGAQVRELVVVEDVAAQSRGHHRDVVAPPDRRHGRLRPGGPRRRCRATEATSARRDGPVERMDPAVGASPGDVGRLGILATCHRQRVERAQQAGVSGRDRRHGLGRPVARRPQAGPVAQLDRGAVRRARTERGPGRGPRCRPPRRTPRPPRPPGAGRAAATRPVRPRQLGLRHAPVRRPGRDRLQPGQRVRPPGGSTGSVRPVPHQRVLRGDAVADGATLPSTTVVSRT